MKTLCTTCELGLVIELDCGYSSKSGSDEKERHFESKCTFGHSDSYFEGVIACNQYKKRANKVTYYDPDFDEYAKKVEEGSEPEKDIEVKK